MNNVTDGSNLGRITAGLVMGSLTLALVGLAAALEPMGTTAVGHPVGRWLFPVAAIVTLLIAALSSSARTAWGRLCLMNGVLSVALAGGSVQYDRPLWPADPLYELALDQGMEWWLRHVVWTTAAYVAATVVIAAALFALSYWLLHSPHVRHRQAH